MIPVLCFPKSMLFTIILFIETTCLLFAVLCLRKEHSLWKGFIPFLILTVAVEATGYILFFVEGLNNHWVFNLYLFFEMAFIFYLLYRLCREYFKAGYLLLPAFI